MPQLFQRKTKALDLLPFTPAIVSTASTNETPGPLRLRELAPGCTYDYGSKLSSTLSSSWALLFDTEILSRDGQSLTRLPSAVVLAKRGTFFIRPTLHRKFMCREPGCPIRGFHTDAQSVLRLAAGPIPGSSPPKTTLVVETWGIHEWESTVRSMFGPA